ncbi:protein phosphatase 1 regulatory subunit 16A isoform X1 [Drosophila novamexicana]|uniref:protein phosphatase 1 regulatory subunit 16A isoform X1 n=1 Tax=Drosophila novamexicana TaxID=47314 RepID=UPI0011E5AFF1|nr:protein phosphatase 1 regulatory subunit 16A isoform X1 [Drosophila novamexicana]XP_030568326.1 protein phosphatase 1 regulatory subunit 16A isoform X1 [Drosophila novamexicana]XP_030568330.1 protein phosphatase 1 regulatory subunit 16A isoform X1 [Drosophila novamexicana]XP_030568340.1 protein phosphatase 1 regulatory subunit 16A isoform X1 [Drosophila novamexicana]XP_030568349.1 protein phosphatase 1 regulatory subunit 16A isoform X1 [Drosophila novamexicana]XP_030568357.1 protein phospha
MIKGILIQRKSQEDASYAKQLKMEHADLVAEMQTVESLPTHERLQLARLRRAQQLKLARQKEKEWLKLQRAKGQTGSGSGGGGGGTVSSILNGAAGDTTHHFRHANGTGTLSGRRHISFENSVVLLEAASRNDMPEVAALLQHGITPDAANEDGLTALHQCCIDNNVDMLRLLLDYGANVDAQDSDKWTPLHAAATCGHLELVRILIRHNANLLAVNTDGNMPYDLCDDENTLDFIEGEMAQRGVTQELIDETRSSTERVMLKDLMELARTGADLEEPDYQGATPLHIASANGYVRVVEFLLEQHVNVDAMDKDLWTPVHAAACWGHLEVLEMLAQCGADLNVRNKDDETPSDICEDPEIRERIEQLKTEQESKRLAEAQRRRVRRSQSNNTRAQSVRRTSLRDKTLTTKKDAVEEARLRLQAQEATDTNSTTAPAAAELPNGYGYHTTSSSGGNNNVSSNSNNNNNAEKRPSTGSLSSQLLSHSKSADAVDNITLTTTHSYLPRRPPDGRENDEQLLLKAGDAVVGELQRATSAAAVILTDKGTAASAEAVQIQSSKAAGNGKINVQVTVLVDTNSTHHQQQQHSQQHQQQLQQHALLLQQHHHQQQQQLQQHHQQHQQQQQQYVAMDAGAVTLSNLKKQRSLSRTANVLNNFELSSTTTAATASTTTSTTTTTTNGSVLGAATSVNHNNNNNNNNSSANNNNNNNNNLSTGPIASQPLGLGAMSPSLLDFDTAAPAATAAAAAAVGNANSVNKFSGNTGDVVSDSTSTSRKCCTLM